MPQAGPLPHIHILHTSEVGGYLRHVEGYEHPEAQLLALARALSVSPLWTEVGAKVLVVRPSPSPVLGVLGHLDSVAKARLEGLRWQLTNILPRCRYLTYAQVEEACERLAARFRERFDRGDLRRFRFTALPRGGFIVLGMLAYLLDIKQAQLTSPHPQDAPLVVIDDCAISGLRFGRFLEDCGPRQLVFATLFSHPELRRAIEAREERVVACISAYDGHDYAPGALGDDYAAWKARWTERSDPRAYWVGQPEHICFPWNEPDVAIWNQVTSEQERGWQLAPPELCIKNRPMSGASSVEVQVQAPGRGPLRPSDHTFYGDLEGQVIVCNLNTGESFALGEVGSDMWRALVEFGDIDVAVAALTQHYAVGESVLRADVGAFVEQLVEQQLLGKSAS
jgi:hypothetical protein